MQWCVMDIQVQIMHEMQIKYLNYVRSKLTAEQESHLLTFIEPLLGHCGYHGAMVGLARTLLVS